MDDKKQIIEQRRGPGQPPKFGERGTYPVSARLPTSLYVQIVKLCKRRGWSVSDFMLMGVQALLDDPEIGLKWNGTLLGLGDRKGQRLRSN